MGRKIKIGKISKQKQFDLNKPRFNGYAIGHGPHESNKYNRRKNKDDFTKLLQEQENDEQEN